jgi:hypothetical protein
MKGFFTNLVDRHLGTCETIQPRSLGRFETDQNSLVGADNTMADVTERNQTLQTSDEFSIANSPTITDRKPDPIERKNDISPLSSPDKNQINTSTQSTFTEQHLNKLDSQVPPLISQVAQSLDNDAPTKSANIKQNQTKHPTLLDDEEIINSLTKNNSDTLDNVISDNNPLPKTSNSEQILETELNHRIQAMFNHLTKDISSPETSGNQNDQRKKNNNENLMSVLPHTEVPLLDTASPDQASSERNNNRNNDEPLVTVLPETKIPLLDSVIASPELSPVAKSKIIQGKNSFSENKNIPSNQSQLEPPSWLSDMTTQLTQRLQDAEQKTDPVINVTIGRVEVRAVQTDTQKITRQAKKPTGVMTLDDYLKRCENRGAK